MEKEFKNWTDAAKDKGKPVGKDEVADILRRHLHVAKAEQQNSLKYFRRKKGKEFPSGLSSWNNDKALQESIYNTALLVLPTVNYDDARFKSLLKGSIFESLTYGHLAASEAEIGNTVLSNKQTLAVCKDMYPRAQRINNTRFTESLLGVYVPDGLLFNRWEEVTGVVEYKTSLLDHEGRISNQLSKGYPTFVSNIGSTVKETPLLLVTPEGINKRHLKDMPFVENRTTNVHREALRRTINRWYKTYTPHAGGKTLEQAWIDQF